MYPCVSVYTACQSRGTCLSKMLGIFRVNCIGETTVRTFMADVKAFDLSAPRVLSVYSFF